jgi:hypothetical protein
MDKKLDNKKKIIIIGIICIGILVIILMAFNCLNKEEKAIYENIYAEQTNFKDPSSVKVISGKICDNLAIVKIGANNSYGAMTTNSYLIILDQEEKVLFDLDTDSNSSEDELKISYEAYKLYLACETTNDEKQLSENSIKKINKKLASRFN